jgi:hypothetical protein
VNHLQSITRCSGAIRPGSAAVADSVGEHGAAAERARRLLDELGGVRTGHPETLRLIGRSGWVVESTCERAVSRSCVEATQKAPSPR